MDSMALQMRRSKGTKWTYIILEDAAHVHALHDRVVELQHHLGLVLHPGRHVLWNCMRAPSACYRGSASMYLPLSLSLARMRIGCAVRRIDNLQQQQVVNASPSREEPRHVLAGCLPEYHHGYLIGVEIVSIWYQTGIITVSHELCTLYE
jgi:hypothetical protein